MNWLMFTAGLSIGVFIGILIVACRNGSSDYDDLVSLGEESNHPVSQEIKESNHG